jgi:hypothetical protein
MKRNEAEVEHHQGIATLLTAIIPFTVSHSDTTMQIPYPI